jgi:hypothetical protein
MFPQQLEGAQFDGLKKEANKLKVNKSSGTAGPGYVQRPKLASASHPNDAFYPDICKTPTIPERDLHA